MVLPWREEHLQETISRTQENIENYKKWLKECEEIIKFRRLQIKVLEAEIKEDQEQIKTYEFGILHSEMEILKLKEILKEKPMDKLIKKSFGKIKKEVSRDEKKLLKKDRVMDKKIDRCKMKRSAAKSSKGMNKE